MNERDTYPWYKQFWPWFLIVLPGTAVVASLYTVSLAMRSSDSLVTIADGGMDVVAAQHIAAERRAIALGLTATLDIDTQTGAIGASLPARLSESLPQVLDLLLSHPTDALKDRTISLNRALPDKDGNPVYAGHIVSVPGGRWYVVLTPAGDASDQWRLNGVWHGEQSVRLMPASDGHDEPS